MQQTLCERRNGLRVEKPVCTWVGFGVEPAAYATQCIDVGSHGAAFKMTHEVRSGERVRVSLMLQPAIIECDGEVCWIRQDTEGLSEFGVRFMDLDETRRTLLRDLLGSE